MNEHSPERAPKRYEEAVAFVTEMISSGSLAPGDRVPSLRDVSTRLRMSMTSAIRAYGVLEDQGVLEARSKSGFFVAPHARPVLAPPRPSPSATRSVDVSVTKDVTALLRHVTNTSLLPLGCALPSPDLLASNPLDRFLARAARVHGRRANVYSETRGEVGLRREIARRVERWGTVIDIGDISVTCGCTEALYLALTSVARAGDTIAIESPSYFGVLQIMERLGLKALELSTDPQTGVDIDAMDQALAENRVSACVLSSCFNNPVGYSMPEENKIKALEVLYRHGVPLIEDDIYGDLHFGPERGRPFLAFDRHDNVIHCSSISKTLAPGYRLGWVISRRYIQRIVETKFSTTLCNPVLPQMALEEFFRSGGFDSHLRRLRKCFAETVGRMSQAIDKYFPDQTRVSRPAGGFVLWLELPEQVDGMDLSERALKEGICIAPGFLFSASRRYGNFVRLSCGYPWDDRMEKGVARLGALVAETMFAEPVKTVYSSRP